MAAAAATSEQVGQRENKGVLTSLTGLGASERWLERQSLLYTSHYCEENVYKLLERVQQHHPEQLDRWYALFLSNQARHMAIFAQSLGDPVRGSVVVWDYHVIALRLGAAHPSAAEDLVFDFDSVLPFPCDAETYLNATFPYSFLDLAHNMRAQVHMVPAKQFLSTFASDRSHMRRHDGSYTKPPPPYPCIHSPDAPSTNNLSAFLAIRGAQDVGPVPASLPHAPDATQHAAQRGDEHGHDHQSRPSTRSKSARPSGIAPPMHGPGSHGISPVHADENLWLTISELRQHLQ
ncbi:uncharacterized protein MONBRDRAFT_10698 [Monosiga brevicollis MX1]|uniref:Protein N-terminal glutamine amidohydrolase n=1 Tax=Monosiga brevicollis TaxID=81824 RepID=A9V6Z3_MONBE|nr:uncharacterized protein MONBRDRAFT_10698 [Monosiga brevicollis MX1]EDQ86700.1 predicted protein [Monosiga brevicollis MX1]|eukprot:XP_001748536.1 hypothetical protein [Monosiga brevicollis MX1]